MLRRVKMSDDIHIVIDCSIEALPEILKQVVYHTLFQFNLNKNQIYSQAQQVGLMTDYHQFIITTMDMHTIDLEPYQYSGTNITGIRLVDPDNPLMQTVTNFIKGAPAISPENGGGEGEGDEDNENNEGGEKTETEGEITPTDEMVEGILFKFNF